MAAIEIHHVSKRYQNGTAALEDISFCIDGGVFGLLGHNGAGKTTLMKALTTILAPSAGTIRVCGFDTVKQGKEVRRRIGYLPQELAMYPSLTVFDFVNYMAGLKGIHDKNAVYAVLEQVEMLPFADRKIGRLSGGMRRRTGIAQALVGSPQVLVADEPTAGLDPEERVRFRSVLSRYAREGRTVLLSTHIVEDVYQLCAELAVLREGRLFYAGTSAALMERVAGKVKIVRLDGEDGLVALQKQTAVLSAAYEGHGISARIMDENMAFPQAEPAAATLEDAYVYCMGGKAYGQRLINPSV
ncbi:MAG: ABC transporter ATP-binding protein [Oscillospiraceae bacterium]|nr:ABC transporter ATP-binding protein [Oscillospiraceae bacterium]